MLRFLAFTVLAVALTTMPLRAETSAEVVVPGQAVGGIRLGGTITEAMTLLGDIVDKSDRGSYVVYDWPLRPLLVIAEKDSGKIVLVLVQLSDAYRTEHAITGGSARVAVEKAYGKEFSADENQRSTTLVYDELGIAFDIGKLGVMQDRVTSIFVFMPGQWKKITAEL
jgi:hypothetical protein